MRHVGGASGFGPGLVLVQAPSQLEATQEQVPLQRTGMTSCVCVCVCETRWYLPWNAHQARMRLWCRNISLSLSLPVSVSVCVCVCVLDFVWGLSPTDPAVTSLWLAGGGGAGLAVTLSRFSKLELYQALIWREREF